MYLVVIHHISWYLIRSWSYLPSNEQSDRHSALPRRIPQLQWWHTCHEHLGSWWRGNPRPIQKMLLASNFVQLPDTPSFPSLPSVPLQKPHVLPQTSAKPVVWCRISHVARHSDNHGRWLPLLFRLPSCFAFPVATNWAKALSAKPSRALPAWWNSINRRRHHQHQLALPNKSESWMSYPTDSLNLNLNNN